MIGYLRGTPVITDRKLLLLVGGVGYQVQVSSLTIANLNAQTEAELYIYTHVREDTLELFGFPNLNQKEIFEYLLSVSGVGPKTALALTEIGVNGIIEAVQQGDTTVFTQVPRVGKKLAQKIIIDLKPKLGDLRDLNLGPISLVEEDVRAALISLGYGENDIQSVVTQLDFNDDANAGLLVKQAIKLMMSH